MRGFIWLCVREGIQRDTKVMLEEGEDQVTNPGGRKISVDGGSAEKNQEANREAGTQATQEGGRGSQEVAG